MAGSILLILCVALLTNASDISASKLLSQLRTRTGTPTNGNMGNVDRNLVGQHRTDEEKLAKKGDLGERESTGQDDAELVKRRKKLSLIVYQFPLGYYEYQPKLLHRTLNRGAIRDYSRKLFEYVFIRKPKGQLLDVKKRSSTSPIDKRDMFRICSNGFGLVKRRHSLRHFCGFGLDGWIMIR